MLLTLFMRKKNLGMFRFSQGAPMTQGTADGDFTGGASVARPLC